eukprot:2679093-Prymnesium_polylepis.1
MAVKFECCSRQVIKLVPADAFGKVMIKPSGSPPPVEATSAKHAWAGVANVSTRRTLAATFKSLCQGDGRAESNHVRP